MTKKMNDIPFSSFIDASVVSHFIYAVPAVSSILLLKLMDGISLFCVFFPMVITFIYIGAAFTWLLTKGSNWENTPIAIKTPCGYTSIYGGVLGGVIGFYFLGTLERVILAIVFIIVALVAAIPLDKYLSRKIYSETTS